MTLFIKKLLTGIKILFREGPTAFFQALKRNLSVSNKTDEINLVYKILQADVKTGLMIDVGAHQGHTLLPFAERKWKIFAFEPDSANRKVLTDRFGEMQNIIIDPRALSDHAQAKVTLFKSEVSTGISSLSPFHSSHSPAEEVNITTLEIFLKEKNLINQNIDFLKIDTEGHDLFVLKGFPWDSQSPRVIICEFEDAKTSLLGYNFKDISQFLDEKGYKQIISEWHPIKSYGSSHRWRCFLEYPCELTDKNSWGNIIAVKEDDIYQSLLQLCNK